jgi:O-antigen ligase
LFTPDASPARTSIEQRSATALLWLHQLPPWLAPVLAVALLVIGLAVGGWGGALAFAALAVVLGWLALISWPRLSPHGRLLRLAVVAAVLVVAVVRGLH